MKQYYITTAINYTNGPPHLGHAYEVILSDIIARFYRMNSFDVCFCTGTDEHGKKISDTAIKENKTPIELCDFYVDLFQSLNGQLNISNDIYIRTTYPHHEKFSQWLWTITDNNGDIYLDEYEGWYNVNEESYVSETEAVSKNYKDDTGNPLIRTKEPSYFFRMSKYQQQLIDHIHDHPNFILPDTKRNEILTKLKEPLSDLSISRINLKWGIPVPNNPEHVMYVWFDALSNYLSAIHYNDKDNFDRNYWPANVHIIGKDIVWFHAVIWPCILFSTEIPLPNTIFCHGFVNDDHGKKMAKSVGNVINPIDILEKYNSDTIRYYFARTGIFGQDLKFSEQSLIILHDSELANGYGNLVNRSTNLIKKWYNNKIPSFEAFPFYDIETLYVNVKRFFELFEIHKALEMILEFLREASRWITEKEPWKMKDVNQYDERGCIVKTMIEVIYILTHYLEPFIPDATHNLMKKLNSNFQPLHMLTWNNLKSETLIESSDILFSRIQKSRYKKKQNK